MEAGAASDSSAWFVLQDLPLTLPFEPVKANDQRKLVARKGEREPTGKRYGHLGFRHLIYKGHPGPIRVLKVAVLVEAVAWESREVTHICNIPRVPSRGW